MEQKLVFIDLNLNVANFYNIKIEKNNSEYYLIVSSGKIGNKGKTSIIYNGKDYKKCKDEFWSRVNEKKLLRYKKYEDISSEIEKIFSHNKESISYSCSVCNKELGKALYYKIDKYLRSDPDIDKDKDNPLYKKVCCFDCQVKLGIYKGKKASDETTNK